MDEILVAMYLVAEFCRINGGFYSNGQFCSAEYKERWLYEWLE